MALKFGVCVNPVDTPQDFSTLVQRIEGGGFDYLWIPDIALLARDAISYLTLATIRTSTIKLGPSVLHPFVRHPAYSVNAVATLDEISGGRFLFGMGIGGREILREVACDPASMGVLREWVAVTRRLLAGETVTHESRQYGLREARLRIKGRNIIPIYIAATGPKMLSLAGELGEGAFAMVGVHPKCVAFAVNQIRRGAKAAGKDPRIMDIGLYVHCSVSKSRAKALNDCRRGAGVISIRNQDYAEMAGMSSADLERITRVIERGTSFAREFGEAVPDDVVTRFALAGTPEDCRRALEEVAEIGISRVDIYLQGPDRQETVLLFAEEVLPYLRN